MKLDKYNWGRAVCFFPTFRDKPGVIRLAWVLQDFHNEDVGCAFPSRLTLAGLLGADPASVSRWLGILAKGGAITRMPRGALPADQQAMTGRTSRRAQVYVLNLGWASQVSEYRDETRLEKVTPQPPSKPRKVTMQPPISDAARVTSQPPSELRGDYPATVKGDYPVTLKGDTPATLIPYGDTLEETLQEVRLEEEALVLTRTNQKKLAPPLAYEDPSIAALRRAAAFNGGAV